MGNFYPIEPGTKVIAIKPPPTVDGWNMYTAIYGKTFTIGRAKTDIIRGHMVAELAEVKKYWPIEYLMPAESEINKAATPASEPVSQFGR